MRVSRKYVGVVNALSLRKRTADFCRDRGNGVGHLWGHVQVIKAPVLLELSGPVFMSYPAINHVEVKLDQVAGGTKVTLRHRAIGLLEDAHRQNISKGWQHYLDNISKDFV